MDGHVADIAVGLTRWVFAHRVQMHRSRRAGQQHRRAGLPAGLMQWADRAKSSVQLTSRNLLWASHYGCHISRPPVIDAPLRFLGTG